LLRSHPGAQLLHGNGTQRTAAQHKWRGVAV
jgi:hypothetical protein